MIGCRIGVAPDGIRGVFALRELSHKATAIRVPRCSTLCVPDSTASEEGREAMREALAAWQARHEPLPPLLVDFLMGDAAWDVKLAGWLLWLRRHCSVPVWQAFCAALPTEAELSCFYSFSPQESEELQFSAWKAHAARERAFAAKVHDLTLSSSSASAQLSSLDLAPTLSHTTWALSTVRSRSLSGRVSAPPPAGAAAAVAGRRKPRLWLMLVPLGDMINHGPAPNTRFGLTDGGDCFCMTIMDGAAPGQQLLCSYGPDKPNLVLLRDYGFTMEANGNDRISELLTSELGLAPLDAQLLLQSSGVDATQLALRLLPGEGGFGAVLPPALPAAAERRCSALLSLPVAGGWAAALRFRGPVTGAAASVGGDAGAFDAAAQRHSADMLRYQCAQLLRLCPTTAEEDRRWLEAAAAAAAAEGGGVEGGATSLRRRQAVVARRQHKLLLAECLAVCERAVALLDGGWRGSALGLER